MTREWVRLALNDPDGLNSLFLNAARHLSVSHPQQQQQERYAELAVRYKVLCVRAVSQAIGSSGTGVGSFSDTVFAETLALAFDELLLGDQVMIKRHVQGAVHMVESNGGWHTLGLNGFLEILLLRGSVVLVTGATGFVAGHVIKAFLDRGFKVRGTVRDLDKASWLVKDLLKTYAAKGDLELVAVPDFADEHAFDEAVKGVSAIAHVASIVTFDSDPNKVIPQTVLGTTSILGSALKEPSVKEFVYTSSIVATAMPIPGIEANVTHDTFNDAAVKLAWSPSASGGVVYMASKVEAEKAVWKFVEEKAPHFTVNVVNPAYIIGEPLHRSHANSPGAWLKPLYDGNLEALSLSPAIYTVDVKDVAVLHAAAVIDPEVKNARLQAWADNTNWNGLLAILRKQWPDKKFIDDLPGLGTMSITTDFTQPLGLLKKWAGQEGWKPLEETVDDNIRGIVDLTEGDLL
ncbi:hypothetical protein OQA88_9279 [Cercophora sp. LCS_1]